MATGRSLFSRILRGFAYTVGILIAIAFGIYYAETNNVRSLTSHLPPIDRIEIEFVHVRFETIDKVIATKTLTGAEAQELTNIWRSQNYVYGIEVNCHAPAYRIRFYQKDKLLTEATICFNCHNIYFYKYAGSKKQTDHIEADFGNLFRDSDDNNSTKLRTRLASLFPGHDIESESSKRPN